MMTKKEFVACVMQDIKEETDGQGKYMKLAYDVPEPYQQTLLKMAKDEGDHRDALIKMLSELATEEDDHAWTSTRTAK